MRFLRTLQPSQDCFLVTELIGRQYVSRAICLTSVIERGRVEARRLGRHIKSEVELCMFQWLRQQVLCGRNCQYSKMGPRQVFIPKLFWSEHFRDVRYVSARSNCAACLFNVLKLRKHNPKLEIPPGPTSRGIFPYFQLIFNVQLCGNSYSSLYHFFSPHKVELFLNSYLRPASGSGHSIVPMEKRPDDASSMGKHSLLRTADFPRTWEHPYGSQAI
jgi:hypothetical protein